MTEITKEDLVRAEGLWRDARAIAGLGLPIYAPAIDALIPRITPATRTMAVDKHYRCYANPFFLLALEEMAKAVSDEAPCPTCGDASHHPLAYIAGIIYHEVQHVVRRHHARFDQFLMPSKDFKKANYAMDMEINDDATELFRLSHKDTRGKSPKLCFPEGFIHPDQADLPVDNVWEWYYQNIPEDMEMSDDHVHLTMPTDDYFADEGSAPSVPEGEQSIIEERIAQNINEAAKRGHFPGGYMLDWARERVPRSSYDWKKEFSKTVLSSLRKCFGYSRQTWKKYHKNTVTYDFKIVQRGRFSTKPEIAVLVDTSGSMFGGRAVTAMSQLGKMISQLRAKTTVFFGDAETYEPQVVSRISQLKPQGGGGTSMRQCMLPVVKYAKENGINVIVLVTDGETDYPTKAEMQGIELILCRINEERESSYYPLPTYSKNVWIPPHGRVIYD